MKCRPSLCRHLAVVAVVASLAVVSGPGSAATASEPDSPPILTGITYLNGPFARVGWNSVPVARVELSGPAQGDTAVTTASSTTVVATVPGSVVVPTGMTMAEVPVTGLSAGTTTLSASLGATTVTAAPDLEVGGVAQVPDLQDVSIEPASIAPDETATLRATLDFLAPPGGTQLSLGSSPPTVILPATYNVPQDTYKVAVPVQASDQTGQFSISVTLGAVTKTALLTVVEPPPTPPPGDTPPAADTTAPDTLITALKVRRAKRKARFVFASTEAGSTFACRLDGKAFAPCTSPWGSRRLKPGRHVFSVQARDAAGNTDGSPAERVFRIKRKR